MDAITPAIDMRPSDVLNGTKCDGIELTANLFKDHKLSIDDKNQRLETYLRIRSLPNSSPEDRNNYFQVIDSNSLLVIPPKGSNANKFSSDSERKHFTFTKIFDESVDQLSVYEVFAVPVVRRFLGGQNALLFDYGITSSGKSYTMRGTTVNPGVIPRALNTVFEIIGHKIEKEVPYLKPNSFSDCCFMSESDRELEEYVRQFVFSYTEKRVESLMTSFRSQISLINENTNQSIIWNDVLHSTFRTDESSIRCTVWISFYEIYNEIIYDLLALDVEEEKKQKIGILKDEMNNYYVKGLRQICVSSAEEAYRVLLFGQNNLHISSTNLNQHSSRSHCAFDITLVKTYINARTKRQEYYVNHLSICDLAGAERSEKANNTGVRIREAGKINGSLLSLSRCISTIRFNQKFEHEPSKKRFVNFRDSKLTKVFQPFLSGSGTAAMMSNMNPSLNLFDETLFALKFTGVAAQVVVSTEVQRNRVHESLKRLTQLWMQSSQRWSNFAHLNPPKTSVSIIETIQEEDEEETDPQNYRMNLTVEEFERKVGEMTQIMDKSRADPQELEVLKTQIDFLIEKLKQTESDKCELEFEIRQQVTTEFEKILDDMNDLAEDKDKSKKKLEEMMTKRLITSENMHKKEKLELEGKLTSFETEIFELREELCRTKDERDRALTEVELINRVLSDKEDTIKGFETESQSKEFKDMKTSPMKESINTSSLSIDMRDANTSTLCVAIKDANTSSHCVDTKDANTSSHYVDTKDANTSSHCVDTKDANTSSYCVDTKDANTSSHCVDTKDVNTSSHCVDTKDVNTSSHCVDTKDVNTSSHCVDTTNANTSAIDFNSSQNSSVEYMNKSIQNSLIESKEVQTSTETLIAMSDKTTITSIEDNVSPSIPMVCKECETTSSSTSPEYCFEDEFVSKNVFNELVNKLHKLENDIKEKEAMVTLNRKNVVERDQKLKLLEEEIDALRESNKVGLSNFNFGQVFHKTSTTCSTTSSVSSFATKSIKSEDLKSISSLDSLNDKLKKTSKYSSRKRKPLNNSIEKRYLHSVNDSSDTTIEEKSSQTSVNSGFADEIGNDVYSTKKSNRRTTKRKQNNNSSENEEFNKYPESKRKRPALRNLYLSPISPIPTQRVVTRSKARKQIDFD